MPVDILKVFIAATLTFFIGIGITPIFTHYAYRFAWWKKTGMKGEAMLGGETTVYNALYGNKEAETHTPRMGGIIIWASVLVTTFVLWVLSVIVLGDVVDKLNFISRNQTWLPLFTLFVGAIIGLANDILDISSSRRGAPRGLSRLTRIGFIVLLGIVGGWWFYAKLGVIALSLPFLGEVTIGFLIIPLFVIFMLGLYSGGIIDGIDGLSGGVFASMYGAFTIIAFSHNQIDVAAFCAAVVGGILAFLWFNIPPARFWMTETGTMALTAALTVVAFLTNSIVPLLIIAMPLIATSASVILQYASKRFRDGKKIFLITPLHHHFEAMGWPSYKVTMRYWILSLVCAIIGTVLALV